MTSFSTKGLFPYEDKQVKLARQRIEQSLDVPKLSAAIDRTTTSNSSLEGAGIIFIDADHRISVLRPFSSNCRKNPIHVVLREPPRQIDERTYAPQLKVSDRESKLVAEAAGAVLSCGAAILSWVVVIGSTATIPLTGGTSATLTYVSSVAGIASGLQCANSLFRVEREVTDPESLDSLDSEEWYQNITLALDVISLGGAAAATATTIKALQTLRKSSGRSTREILRGLNRSERKRLTEEVIRLNHPQISNQALKRLVRSGGYPKRYSQIEITQSLRIRLKDTLAASLTLTGSITAGAINRVALGIHEVVE
mgnify:FL=1